jgi:arylsulfatase A-like enzyme
MRPNVLFIMSDDHAAHAMSCYGSRINETPNLDRIAHGGMRFDNCFCTNSICTPSRAAILTGTYNHVNEVTTLNTPMDNRLATYPKLMRDSGYQTAVFGKWHLGHGPAHDPAGFDDWCVLPEQGLYHDPEFITRAGRTKEHGYVTDLITDYSLNWLKKRDRSKPFCLMVHHKAPHQRWEPDAKHATMYDGVTVPEPDTLFDDYSDRARGARDARMRISLHLGEKDLKHPIPRDMAEMELRRWAYQHYIKDYLRVVASVDDNVGRLLDYLDEDAIADDTIVVYTSDQGFFLGDHGWYDKRFMYEESLRMPFVMRYPREIQPEGANSEMILNVDFAPTFLDYAEVEVPEKLQGSSFRRLAAGRTPERWQDAMYYRYWMHGTNHRVPAHYGVRTARYKLIYYYAHSFGLPGCTEFPSEPAWELFDLEKDPRELHSVYEDPAYAPTVKDLKQMLDTLQRKVGDEPFAGA